MRVRNVHSATTILEAMLAAEKRRARLFEWVMTVAMFGVAFTLVVSPMSILLGSMHLMRQIGLTAPVIIILFCVGATFRAVGLYMNGASSVYGPRLRAAGAAIGAIVWAQICLAQLVDFLSSTGTYLPAGATLFGCISIGEIVACYRAARDVRC